MVTYICACIPARPTALDYGELQLLCGCPDRSVVVTVCSSVCRSACPCVPGLLTRKPKGVGKSKTGINEEYGCAKFRMRRSTLALGLHSTRRPADGRIICRHWTDILYTFLVNIALGSTTRRWITNRSAQPTNRHQLTITTSQESTSGL